jgi:hypothetical protein
MKIKKYQKILIDFVEEFAKAPFSIQKNLENQVIADTKRNHFQVLTVGWDSNQFVYNVILHFDIKGDKIWIQQNWTDMKITDDLIERGVLESDIVIGFLPSSMRSQVSMV